eukprot:NODE_31_length_37178_cov_0.413576.p23 type:complete len:178 gc:universal NODE_31_length_37178_cov_0.413576:32787-33320(+)
MFQYYLTFLVNLFLDFLKSLNPDSNALQVFYATRSQREMEIHNTKVINIEKMKPKILPPEIWEQILIHADCIPYMLMERSQEMRFFEADYCYLDLFISPNGNLFNQTEEKHRKFINNCRFISKIEFICQSHDQGWSSFHEHHGTIENSWTFGEIHLSCANDDYRQRVYTNLHARRDY